MFIKISKKNSLINLYFITISLLLTYLYLGKDNLSIFNFSWLFNGDASSDLINWLNFKNSNWTFPFGVYTLGDLGENAIVFTGAIPIFSVILKIFFKSSINFHFFSLWIFLCFYLQYLFSYLILKYFLKEDFTSILGSIFFVLSPIFINKLGVHFSLGAHWIILLYFFYKIKNFENNWYFIIIICLSTLIHFYFTMMIFSIEILHCIFIKKIFKNKKIFFQLKYYLYAFSFTILTMYLFGYFSIPLQDTIGYGYGVYKLNILSVINPTGLINGAYFNWSSFLPTIDLNYGEQEGFNYFGLGFLLMFIVYIFSSYTNKIKKIKYEYCYIIILIIFFSLSNNVDLGRIDIINIELNKFVEGVLSVARASGRFFWPVYYFLLLCCIINVKNVFKTHYKEIIILFLIIQVVDLWPGYKRYLNSGAHNDKVISIDNKLWYEIINKDKIFTSTYQKNQSSDFYKILPLSVKNNFNSEIQYFARYDRGQLIDLRYKNYQKILNNKLDKNRIYIVNNMGHANHIKNVLDPNGTHEFIEIDNIKILIDKNLSKTLKTNKKFLKNIQSKKIDLDLIYEPEFREGSDELSFLGIGWTKHGNNLAAVSDGSFAALFFNLSELELDNYQLVIDIQGKIKNLNQNIIININDEFNFKKEIILNKKNESAQILIPINLKKMNNNENYLIDFNITGQVTDFEILKSPDRKKIGFKINSIKLIKL